MPILTPVVTSAVHVLIPRLILPGVTVDVSIANLRVLDLVAVLQTQPVAALKSLLWIQEIARYGLTT